VALAHPDDETFICGEHGRRLGRPPFATRESLPDVREAELRAACAALGIEGLHLLGLRDKCLEFEDPDALAARVGAFIRRLRPDAVLTFHERRGGHPDHCAIGRAAEIAWRRSGDPSWHPELGPPFQPPRLYFLAGRDVFEHPDRHGTVPEAKTVVDCAPVAEALLAAHRAHRSQTELDAGLWDDAAAPARFRGRREIYQQAAPPFVPEERGLLGRGG
jgi:LmbE family N-acetylglucosaminyl deacetylase